METLSALLAICAGNSPVPGEFPVQRPVTRSFDVFFDLHPNKRLSKQSWGRWFETPSRPLWRQCNVSGIYWEVSTKMSPLSPWCPVIQRWCTNSHGDHIAVYNQGENDLTWSCFNFPSTYIYRMIMVEVHEKMSMWTKSVFHRNIAATNLGIYG